MDMNIYSYDTYLQTKPKDPFSFHVKHITLTLKLAATSSAFYCILETFGMVLLLTQSCLNSCT